MTAARPAVHARLARMHRWIPLAALLTITVACAHDGRTLRPPNPNQTLSIVTTTVAPSTTVPSLSLILPFADGGTIDPRFTCKAVDGKGGVSPGISWGAVPSGTVELALVVIDADASGFVHWVVAGIDPNALTSIPEGTVPAGVHQATNSFGKVGWGGPCPPSGTHHYVFTLHALSEPTGVTDAMPAADALNLIQGRSVAKAVVTATFGV